MFNAISLLLANIIGILCVLFLIGFLGYAAYRVFFQRRAWQKEVDRLDDSEKFVKTTGTLTGRTNTTISPMSRVNKREYTEYEVEYYIEGIKTLGWFEATPGMAAAFEEGMRVRLAYNRKRPSEIKVSEMLDDL